NPCLFDHLVGACEKNIAPSAHSMSAGMLTEVGSLRRPAGQGFALKVQHKVCNGVAGLAAAGSSRDRQENRGGCSPSPLSTAPPFWKPHRRFPTEPCKSTCFHSTPALRTS